MRQGLHQTQNQNSWSWNKGRAFFPLLSIEKIYFPAAVLPDPLQLARSWTAALKKRTVETSLILLLCFFPSVCLLTAILMVGVLLQLRGLRSRIGLCGPSTAFLLHPFHCRLHLCRWQTPTVGFMWAGAFQRCLRCLTSSFSRQLSMPDTLLPSLVENTLKLLSWGMGREGSVGQICPPSPLAQVWEVRKFPELFRASEWAVAGMSMKVLGQSVPHGALSPVRRPSSTGSGVGKWSLHSPAWTVSPAALPASARRRDDLCVCSSCNIYAADLVNGMVFTLY